MTSQQEFLEFLDKILMEQAGKYEISDNVQLFISSLRNTLIEEKPAVTENGVKILEYMQQNTSQPLLRAKDIAEGLFISSRSVSGAIRKLVTDGFVEKVGVSPILYSITNKGKNYNILINKEN